ncbi:MAG TPA: hypothetical protein VEW95_01265 [Candidatus Limnocylindrales bacterium]|nr:hypothetical protein [Candidatus Limnocylindrales bacterium]
MRTLIAANRRTAYGEDAEAVVRALFGLTVGVGAFAIAGAVSTGQAPFIAIPTLALLGCLLLGASIAFAATAAAGIWLILLPSVSGEGTLVPVTMIVVCVAIAVGPDRLVAWVASDATPTPVAPPSDVGWIEEVDGRLG